MLGRLPRVALARGIDGGFDDDEAVHLLAQCAVGGFGFGEHVHVAIILLCDVRAARLSLHRKLRPLSLV
jgi:hypothetical protein